MAKEVKLRVVLSDDDIRKIVFPDGLPNDMFSLMDQIREKFSLSSEFKIQFMDPDFNNEFVNLNSIDDVNDRDTLKLAFSDSSEEVNSITNSSTSSSSTCVFDASVSSEGSSSDTVILPTSPTDHKPWPANFPCPQFSYSTETILAKGNRDFAQEGTHLNPASIKSDILDRLAEEIYKYLAYPTDQQFDSVAESLVKKHPCLQEPGSATGYYGWKVSLKFKMGNFRTKLRNAGCEELCINSLKRKNAGDRFAAKNIKSPERQSKLSSQLPS